MAQGLTKGKRLKCEKRFPTFPAQPFLPEQRKTSQTFPNFPYCSPVWERKCLKIPTLLTGQERLHFLGGRARSSRPGGRGARGDDGCSPQLCSRAVSQPQAGMLSTAPALLQAEEGKALLGPGAVVS